MSSIPEWDQCDAARLRLPGDDHGPHPGPRAQRGDELAVVVAGQAVEAPDDHPVDGRGRQLLGATLRQAPAQGLDLGDLGRVGRDLHLGDGHWGVVAHRGKQLHVHLGRAARGADGLTVQCQPAPGGRAGEPGCQPGTDEAVHHRCVDRFDQPA